MSESPWNCRADYRQDARYEQQLASIIDILEKLRTFKNPSPTWDMWTVGVQIMSQLELFFFEEFERQRKASKRA